MLEEDPSAVARVYRRLVDELGAEAAHRRLGIRVNVGRVPTEEELADAARREHLSVLYLDVPDVAP